MKRFLAASAAFLCFAAAPTVSAQTAGVPLSVRTGDVYTIRLEQTQSSGRDEPGLNGGFSQVVELRIVDAERRIWRYTPVSMSFNFSDDAAAGSPMGTIDWPTVNEGLSALLRIATDVGYECQVNESGACVELTNWPLWRDRAENIVLMFDAFARAAPSPPPAEIMAEEPAFEDNSDGADGGEEGFAAEAETTPAPPPVDWATLRGPLLRGIARLLDGVDARDAAAGMWSMQPPPSFQGRTLVRRQPVEITEEVEMPYGAAPLRFTGRLRLERIDRASNTATISRNVALDYAAARASLQTIAQFIASNVIDPVAAASPSGAESAPSSEALMGMLRSLLDTVDLRYQETGTGVIDLTTGMVRETTTDFVISVTPTEGEGEPFEMRGRTIMRVTPGAPDIPRLPRG